MRSKQSVVVAVLLSLAALRPVAGAPVGTAFTYQGQLKQNGQPVNGNCDFQFGLWNAAAHGSQVGLTIPANNVVVTGGQVTAHLDFGPATFTGEARWLEIAVDCQGAAASSRRWLHGRS